MTAVAAIFTACLGLGFIAAAIFVFRSNRRIAAWPFVEGIVIQRGVKKLPRYTNRPADHTPDIRYQYVVADKRYIGDRIAPTIKAYRTQADALNALQKIPDKILIRYDPTQPDNAYLNDAPGWVPTMYLTIGILLTIIGFLLGLSVSSKG